MSQSTDLAEAFKEQARLIGSKPGFWEDMAAAVLAGKVRGLNPKEMRNPMPTHVIVRKIHEIIGRGPMTKEHEALYLVLVVTILELLDYKPKGDGS